MRSYHSLFAIALFACSTSARAASFDCSKAQRPVEKAICGNQKLNLADEGMGRTYREALGKLSSSGVGVLRADQVQWLAWAQQVCRADVAGTPVAALVKCLQPLYGDRTKRLRLAVVRRDGLTFLTRTQYLAVPEDASSAGSPEYSGFGTLQANWPTADSTDPKWTAWNRAVEARAIRITGSDQKDREIPAPSKLLWPASLAEAQDTVITAQLKSVEGNRVITTVNSETMGHGAAHPNEAFETMTWLLDAGRPLRVQDVFAAGVDWKALVAKACWQALSTGEQKSWIYPEVNGPGAKPLQDVIADISNWTLEHDGLHISYPEYSVAPRVSPVDDTVIPWPQLKPVLAPGFIMP